MTLIEERRYEYRRSIRKDMLRFQLKIAELTEGLIEQKEYSDTAVVGSGHCIGLNPVHKIIRNAARVYLDKINNVDRYTSERVSQTYHMLSWLKGNC